MQQGNKLKMAGMRFLCRDDDTHSDTHTFSARQPSLSQILLKSDMERSRILLQRKVRMGGIPGEVDWVKGGWSWKRHHCQPVKTLWDLMDADGESVQTGLSPEVVMFFTLLCEDRLSMKTPEVLLACPSTVLPLFPRLSRLDRCCLSGHGMSSSSKPL